MRSSKIKGRVLAAILCTSMIFQSMSVSAYASESTEAAAVETEAQSQEDISPDSMSDEEEYVSDNSLERESELQQEETISTPESSEEQETDNTPSSSDGSDTEQSSSSETVSEESSQAETTTEDTSAEESTPQETASEETSDEETTADEETTTDEETAEIEESTLYEEETQLITETEADEDIMLLADSIPTETETENIMMDVSPADAYDNRGAYLHLRVSGNSNDLRSLKFNELKYEVKDSAGNVLAVQNPSVRFTSDGEGILQLEKNNWKDQSTSPISIVIKRDYEKEEEVPTSPGSGGGSGGTTPPDGSGSGGSSPGGGTPPDRSGSGGSSSGGSGTGGTTTPGDTTTTVIVTVHETIAKKEGIEFETDILYAAYNAVNGSLNVAWTSDLTPSKIEVVDGSESTKYTVAPVGTNYYQIKYGEEVVKLEKGTKYFVRFSQGGVTYQKEITWGEYKEGIPSGTRPSQIVVYRPYEYEPVLTYQTTSEDKTELVNGTSYYLFSQSFLSSKELNKKDEIYEIELLNGSNRLGFLTNVVLAEDKWDRTYKIENADGELEKGKPVELYYGNDIYASVKITIENAKAEPELVLGNKTLVNTEIKKANGSDTTYIVTLTANATGTTNATIKVGDIEENFSLKVSTPSTITEIKFFQPSETAQFTTTTTIEGIGRRRDVIISINPKEAIGGNDKITVTSAKEEVVKLVEIKDIDLPSDGDPKYAYQSITLESTGKGEADVTIAVGGLTTPGEKCLTCKVTVTDGVFSDDQKQDLKNRVGALYAATNVNGEIGEVVLPKNWTWVKPETELKIDPNGKLQYFEARYQQESYTPFTTLLPVAVTQITGAYITGDTQLTNKHDGNYQINLKLSGYAVDLKQNTAFAKYLEGIVKCTWQGDEMLTVKNKEGWSTTATAGATDSIAEGAISAAVIIGSSEEFKEELNVMILADHITSISITPKESMKNGIKFNYDESEKAVYIDEGSVSSVANTIVLTATANMEGRKVIINKGVLKWRVNDDSLATITEQEDGTVLLKILKSGTIIVTATAEDVGKKEASIAIEVRDYKPLLESKSFTINKYSTEGVELPIFAVEGNPITTILIDDSNFRVEKNDNRYFLMMGNKDLYSAKTTIKTKIEIRTKLSTNTITSITITVTTNKPKITFKVKTAPNLFYTDRQAVYTVSASGTVLDITNDVEKGSTIVKGFEVTKYDPVKKQLTIRAKGLTAETLEEFKNSKSLLRQVKVLVKYDGYGTIPETIKLSPQNKKPTYKIKPVSTVGAKSSYRTYLYNNADKKEVALGAGSEVTSMTDTVTAEKQQNGQLLLKYSGTKTKSYKLSVTDKNWTAPLTLTGKITMVKSIATALGTTSVTMNMAHNKQTNGVLTIPVEAKNNMESITRIETIGADSKTKKLLESGYLSISFQRSGQYFELGLAENVPAGIKAGTYTIAVTGYIALDGEEFKLTKANLKVKLVNATTKPDVKLTAKSSINLANREGTAIIYTPKITNMTTTITGVKATGENAKYFKTKLLSDGKIEVRAVPEVSMSTVKYPLGLEMTFANNALPVVKNVNIKPTNKLPSIKASATKGTIYKASVNNVKWSVYNAGDFGSIEDKGITVVETKASANFNFSVSKTNVITVSLKPEVKRTIKKGTYTISYQVKVKDAAANVKPKTLKMTITIK